MEACSDCSLVPFEGMVCVVCVKSERNGWSFELFNFFQLFFAPFGGARIAIEVSEPLLWIAGTKKHTTKHNWNQADNDLWALTLRMNWLKYVKSKGLLSIRNSAFLFLLIWVHMGLDGNLVNLGWLLGILLGRALWNEGNFFEIWNGIWRSREEKFVEICRDIYAPVRFFCVGAPLFIDIFSGCMDILTGVTF